MRDTTHTHISRAAQDQQVPHMGSPTYGRLVIIASRVQLPFVYVHTLALLVHCNNILCALSFGCTIGTSMAAILARLGIRLYDRGLLPGGEGHPEGSLSKDLQTISLAFITSFV